VKGSANHLELGLEGIHFLRSPKDFGTHAKNSEANHGRSHLIVHSIIDRRVGLTSAPDGGAIIGYLQVRRDGTVGERVDETRDTRL
jgi:hypothetical protein